MEVKEYFSEHFTSVSNIKFDFFVITPLIYLQECNLPEFKKTSKVYFVWYAINNEI